MRSALGQQSLVGVMLRRPAATLKLDRWRTRFFTPRATTLTWRGGVIFSDALDRFEHGVTTAAPIIVCRQLPPDVEKATGTTCVAISPPVSLAMLKVGLDR